MSRYRKCASCGRTYLAPLHGADSGFCGLHTPLREPDVPKTGLRGIPPKD